MVKNTLLFIGFFGPIIYLMACAVVRSICNNRDQPKRVITLIRSENNLNVIGDGAWKSKPTPSERMRQLREAEPRGA